MRCIQLTTVIHLSSSVLAYYHVFLYLFPQGLTLVVHQWMVTSTLSMAPTLDPHHHHPPKTSNSYSNAQDRTSITTKPQLLPHVLALKLQHSSMALSPMGALSLLTPLLLVIVTLVADRCSRVQVCRLRRISIVRVIILLVRGETLVEPL